MIGRREQVKDSTDCWPDLSTSVKERKKVRKREREEIEIGDREGEGEIGREIEVKRQKYRQQYILN